VSEFVVTDYQALHLVFSHNLYAQCFFDLVIELVCSATRSYDIQIPDICFIFAVVARLACAAIVPPLSVLDRQPAHELDAGVNAVGRELDEVQTPANVLCGFFKGPVAYFYEGAANL
jgi:hypothetical protein